MKESAAPATVLAVSSGGGHWLQLRRLAPAWQGCRVVSACTADAPPMTGEVLRHVRLRDVTRWNLHHLFILAPQLAWLILRVRPDVVITTGALPGFLALLGGRLAGAKTIWIDSLANVQQLSGSGRMARYLADEWWTQWAHLAAPSEQSAPDFMRVKRKPIFHGAVW